MSLKHGKKITVIGTILGGLLIGGTTWNYLNTPSHKEWELAIQIIPISQTVCNNMRILVHSYDGTFQIPTNGVYLEPTHMEIEIKLNSAETIVCQFLGPDLRNYVSYPYIRSRTDLKLAILHHIKSIRDLLLPLQLEPRDVDPVMNNISDIEKLLV